ncbi:cation:dicarboxylate symporter family transporter [Sulfurospirillum sp. hDNRA2]|uniref:cation:dicarboxylate symporter family transporter n=1 Tax=Sulfurospirillum sp. hDNRA2 TaxID=3237298 RepID=UPI0020B64CD6|nr:cation:dicarboxylase symporter family transporter [Sulfurospirillum sp. DNRA8]MCP3651921.1 cation:dicarboxylase symporter family transporter [Sulfurospirillum sp. DNRA8]MCR1810768.1 cation:dicarboxylase symporter family transporter [Sulfurospirillum sp. DNRA8]
MEKTSFKDWKRYTIKSLAFWVVVGIVAGITLGMLNPSLAVQAKPGIDWFIQALKWLVGPIIFLTIISGIVGLESLKEVGSIGLKAFIYFEVVSTFALAIGILFGNLLKPGHGMHLDVESLDVSAVSSFTANASSQTGSVWGILKSAIPTDPITPFLHGNTLQVLVMALVIAIGIAAFGEKYKEAILAPLEKVQNVFFKILTILMWLSPVASFSAMAFLIGKFGIASLIGMASLLGVMLISVLAFLFGVLGIILWFYKINVFKFMRFIAKEVLIVFATSSSESALAPLMKRLEAAGVSRGTTGLVIPTGYSFNLDCTNIYLSLSIIFLAQAFGIPLTLSHELSIIFILMVASKGAVGVTGSGFIVLAGTLSAMGDVIPVATVAVLLGVDKFMSEMRAVGNLCGNAVAAVVVGAWDKQIDMEKFRYALDHPESVEDAIPG